jgi:hypothetical protein
MGPFELCIVKTTNPKNLDYTRDLKQFEIQLLKQEGI